MSEVFDEAELRDQVRALRTLGVYSPELEEATVQLMRSLQTTPSETDWLEDPHTAELMARMQAALTSDQALEFARIIRESGEEVIAAAAALGIPLDVSEEGMLERWRYARALIADGDGGSVRP